MHSQPDREGTIAPEVATPSADLATHEVRGAEGADEIHVTAPILVIASIWLGNAILIEATLSFLGVGTQPPTPSWGLMLSSTGRAFMEQAPWLAIFPGLAISLAVLGFNLFGDTLRDAWDPKLRRQG